MGRRRPASVDQPGKQLVVRQGDYEQPYQFAENVQIQDGKTSVTAADLEKSVGRYVRIRYAVDGDKRVASRIEVLPKKG